MSTKIGFLVAAALLAGSAVQAEDCTLGKQYLSRAQDQLAQSRRAGAVVSLRQSLALCPSYDGYEQLGELLGHSKNRRDWVGAADAFVEAHTLAPSPKARAQTLYQYASLVNDDGDPQNAYPMIMRAAALDPGRQDIAKLSAAIASQVRTPTKSQLTRSFGLSVYKPLHARAADAEAITGAGHRQSNLQINFKFDSVAPNDETRDNVTLLAQSLADPALGKKKFVFVGHSDARGSEQYNTELSLRRAEAMRLAVVQLDPKLAGRIDVQGKGSSEPIDPGTDPQAMSHNRRLQVLDK
jgi:outer membrane protein OmpA-like peptidoglycan-associated protein